MIPCLAVITMARIAAPRPVSICDKPVQPPGTAGHASARNFQRGANRHKTKLQSHSHIGVDVQSRDATLRGEQSVSQRVGGGTCPRRRFTRFGLRHPIYSPKRHARVGT